ncbi:dTDP-4-dehydrorhamnose 3,5-epimerase [Flagellimonas flava]|uniref:dTDP-4-dehydrorhamnose 3,5-epimerase n=1 Tax=Flagellimonas flava TaxID=570519 RepID=A0A1M5L2U5_9FLAO|nr:dTDP-4-dehydrorhamnose 3,5-epimerase [Allomuricauda flava]SHG58743.1 dTDP-4-dehydrorhamnose 3,5-epimerase [Allomuricauda flava]
MTIEKTPLEGCFVIEPNVFQDERGYFMESFNTKKFTQAIGQEVAFVQDNQSFSSRGVLRGLHFQRGKYAQAKLVRVLSGKVLDAVVDLRKDSKTFGEHLTMELSAENKKQLYIPRGLAHGFVVLSETAEFFYKCDNYYHKAAEGGILYNDPSIGIDWQLKKEELTISAKDLELPEFQKLGLYHPELENRHGNH